MSTLAYSTTFASERRIKRKDERTLTSKAPHVSPVADLSNKVMESAISSVIAYTIDVNVSEAFVRIAVDVEPVSTPPLSNLIPSPTHSPP